MRKKSLSTLNWKRKEGFDPDICFDSDFGRIPLLYYAVLQFLVTREFSTTEQEIARDIA